MTHRPILHVEEILQFAKEFHERHGRWPKAKDGPIEGQLELTWLRVDEALRQGLRGLRRGSSLARVLQAHLGVRNRKMLPPFSVNVILSWADAHLERTGSWPVAEEGPITEAPGETWLAVDAALRSGTRGQPGGSSLAHLLAEYRGARNRRTLPPLSHQQILQWADSHHARTGGWPTSKSGKIPEAPGESWNAVQLALIKGGRGLPGGATLPQLLAKHRGVRNRKATPGFSVQMILFWADLYHERTGKWPTHISGPIPDAPGESWSAVHSALSQGGRGLQRGGSLAQFLARHRGVRNHKLLPELSVRQILAWADEYHRLRGEWPSNRDGKIPGAPGAHGETWTTVNLALTRGTRSLPGASSLAQLLTEHRGVRNFRRVPPYTIEQILEWADAHYRRTRKWPTRRSGEIPSAPGETWSAIQTALHEGRRGLPGGATLPQLLAKHRSVRNRVETPKFSVRKILYWADLFHERTGTWPTRFSGPISDAPGETWSAVHSALYQGGRGFPGGDTLFRLLQRSGRGKSRLQEPKKSRARHK